MNDYKNKKEMKEIKSRYANKMVDGKFYGTVEVTGTKDTNDQSGIIFVPYVFKEHTEESSKEYDDFMKEYHKKHKACPKCGSLGYSTTLMGYILNMDKKDEYKDLNGCVCTKCGDSHTVHERVEI